MLVGQLEPLPAKITGGQFSITVPVLAPGSVYTFTVHTDVFAPKPYRVFVPSTPTSTTIGSLPPINGPAPDNPTTPTSLLRLWQLAELYSGLANPSVLTPFPQNDPNSGITLDPGIYQNFLFECSELILPVSGIKLYNCRILCGNSNFGVRLDANSGFETGRYLEHCEITALGTAMSGAGFTARLVKVTGNGDDSARLGRSYAEGSVFELCHFSDYRPAPGAHADGIQIVTPPAADVVVWGCSISMNTATGYTLPSDAGYTGALFVDTSDVPIPVDDPQPGRLGGIWVDSCRLVSSNNYSVVVDGPNTDIRNSTLLPGTTAIESIQPGIVVTGGNNVDANGVPISDTDIHGDPRPRYLTVGDPRVTAGLPTATTGQVLTWNGTEWIAATPSGGGFTPIVVDELMNTASVMFPNTGGEWLVVNRADSSPIQKTLPAAIGHRVFSSVDGMRLLGNAFDYGVIVGGEIVRYYATRTSTPAGDGNVGWYSGGELFTTFVPMPGRRSIVVEEGDLDGDGNITIAMVNKGTGAGGIEAGPDDTFCWTIENVGPTITPT